MVDEKTSNNLLAALQAKAISKKTSAYATLMLYLNNPTAVADHPNVIGDLEKIVSELADAEGQLEILNKYFLDNKTSPELS